MENDALDPAALPDPPRGEGARIAWLRLARSRRVGPVTFRRLLLAHGDAEAALDALPGLAAAAGARDYAPCPAGVAVLEFRAAARAGARPLFLGAPDYPPALAALADAPPLLWLRGDPGLLSREAVALVGARNASALGCRMAGMLAAGLGAAGLVVVSGLARGIDAAAHRAALATGTVAVLAGGVDVPYPPECADLAGQIAAQGALVSEMPMGTEPQTRHFPRRNRLVSGLARAVVVVEGAARSGSLITARAALDQGREVMAVPGNPLDARAAGCNQLIREGATLIRSSADVIEALGGATADQPVPGGVADRAMPARYAGGATPARPDPAASRPGAMAPAPAVPRAADDPGTSRPAPGPDLPAGPDPAAALSGPLAQGEADQRLLALLGPVPIEEDAAIRASGLAVPAAMARLTILELQGRIARHPGGRVSRPPDRVG